MGVKDFGRENTITSCRACTAVFMRLNYGIKLYVNKRMEKMKGRITVDSYIEVLQDLLFGTMEDVRFNADIVFQQDHLRQRTAKSTTKWL